MLSGDVEQRIFGAIDEATWVALASELVRAGQPAAENHWIQMSLLGARRELPIW
jgi:hypothetical protein